MNDVHYINLTNGLEFYAELVAQHITPKILRIPSTILEQNNWNALFRCLSDEFLFDCALGHQVYLYDCGCRRKYSKTIFFGIPVIKYVLERLWYSIDDQYMTFDKLRVSKIKHPATIDDCRRIFCEVFMYLSEKDIILYSELQRKYKYFTRYIHNSQREVYLYGISELTEHDGDKKYFQGIIQQYSSVL